MKRRMNKTRVSRVDTKMVHTEYEDEDVRITIDLENSENGVIEYDSECLILKFKEMLTSFGYRFSYDDMETPCCMEKICNEDD